MTRKPKEPAPRDPGPGWLRSRFMGLPYPRPGVAPCGRPTCPVCGETPIEVAQEVDPLQPLPGTERLIEQRDLDDEEPAR